MEVDNNGNTRKNLKKINDELELLSDDQLDEIAGGINQLERPIVDFFKKQNPEQPPQVKDVRFYARN